MKKLLVLGLSIFLLVGCSNKIEKNDNGYYVVSADEAYMMIEDNSNIKVLDVRTKEEYDNGHLEDAINLEYSLIKEEFTSLVTDDKDSIIIVYCQSGSRAREASKELVSLGYKNVYTFGGITSWQYDIIK